MIIACLKWLFLFCILFIVSIVDIKDGWIPDRFIFASIVGFFLFNLNDMDNLKNRLIAGFSIFAGLYLFVVVFNKIKKMESMGGGDLKLFFVVGLYFGLYKTLFLMFNSCIVGIITAYLTNSKNKTFPFGPSIALASFVIMLFGDVLINLYLCF